MPLQYIQLICHFTFEVARSAFLAAASSRSVRFFDAAYDDSCGGGAEKVGGVGVGHMCCGMGSDDEEGVKMFVIVALVGASNCCGGVAVGCGSKLGISIIIGMCVGGCVGNLGFSLLFSGSSIFSKSFSSAASRAALSGFPYSTAPLFRVTFPGSCAFLVFVMTNKRWRPPHTAFILFLLVVAHLLCFLI